MKNQLVPAIGAAATAFVVVMCAGAMFLVTTFLFAFSGGQVRMVPVVGYGALAVIALTLVVAAAVWKIRSGTAAAQAAAIVTVAGWATAVLVEWLISFMLGAS